MPMLKKHEMKYGQNICLDEWNKFEDRRMNRPPLWG